MHPRGFPVKNGENRRLGVSVYREASSGDQVEKAELDPENETVG
jgi:hypothetical protein